MVKGNISQEFRLTNTDETRNHFVEEIEQNELMSNNYIKVCMKLYWAPSYFSFCNYWIYSNWCFISLFDIPIGIMNSAIELNISAIAARIKRLSQWLRKRNRSMIK